MAPMNNFQIEYSYHIQTKKLKLYTVYICIAIIAQLMKYVQQHQLEILIPC